MPDGQRVVGDEAQREYLLITLASLLGLREVVRKVGPDQLSSIYSSDLDGGFVNVRDFSFRTDGDQRVERGFHQAARVLGCLFLRGYVARGREHAQHIAASILINRGIV